jgi:hypothetical protein
MKKEIEVNGLKVQLKKQADDDYISLTDIARKKNIHEPKDVVKNWLRSKSTIEFLGLWEKINNPRSAGFAILRALINITLFKFFFQENVINRCGNLSTSRILSIS